MKFRIIRVTLSNMRKRKSAALSLAILVMLSSLFLCIGVGIMSDSGKLYAANKKALNQPDNAYMMSKTVYRPEYYDFLQKDPRVASMEEIPAITMELAKYEYEGGEMQIAIALVNLEDTGEMQRMHCIDQMSGELPENGIYLPAVLRNFGYKIGDELVISNKNVNYAFTICGFHRTSGFGITNVGTMQFYLVPQAYQMVKSEVGEGRLISIKCHDVSESKSLDTDLRKQIRNQASSPAETEMNSSFHAEVAELVYSYMGILLAAVFMVFSLLISCIALIIIRFRILNNMEESMVQIGILGAIGFTGGEIQRVFAYEYMITSAIGTVLGTLLSFAAAPPIGSIIGNMVGLKWYSGNHILTEVGVSFLLIVFVVTFCLLIAAKIRKYPPVVALAKGVESHSTKRNYLPLEHTKGNLQVVLAGKEILHFLRQNITILFCIAGISFAVMSSISMYRILGQDLTTIRQISGWEWPSIRIDMGRDADMDKMREEIDAMEGVRKTAYSTQLLSIVAEDNKASLTVFEDFSRLETINALEGRLPIYDNEILVTKNWAERNGKRIGDSVRIEYSGYSVDYIICGFNQSISNNGNMFEMTGEGFQRIYPYGEMDVLDIYLDDSVTTAEIMDRISRRYGSSQENMAENAVNHEAGNTTADSGDGDALTEEEQIIQTANEKISRLMRNYNVDSVDYTVMVDGKMITGSTRTFAIETMVDFNKTFGSQLKSYRDAFAILTMVIFLLAVIVITLMIAIIVRALLSKRKMSLGVMKAMGFTSRQLTTQIALSIMPATILGSILGVIGSAVFGGDLAGAALKSFSVSKVEVSASPIVSVAVCTIILLYTFLVSYFYASKVSKVSVYELLVD